MKAEATECTKEHLLDVFRGYDEKKTGSLTRDAVETLLFKIAIMQEGRHFEQDVLFCKFARHMLDRLTDSATCCVSYERLVDYLWQPSDIEKEHFDRVVSASRCVFFDTGGKLEAFVSDLCRQYPSQSDKLKEAMALFKEHMLTLDLLQDMSDRHWQQLGLLVGIEVLLRRELLHISSRSGTQQIDNTPLNHRCQGTPASPTMGLSTLRDSKPKLAKARSVLMTDGNRDRTPGVVSSWTKPVVISAPGLQDMATSLSRRLGCEEFPDSEGPTLSMERFKSNDPNMRFNWKRVVGRKIIFLFDTVDQSRLFEQLSLLQALQGFPIPDGEDKGTKWKTYATAGAYAWGRASHITVVMPWYRPCQMERTSRWALKPEGGWTNGDPEGQWLDVPCAQHMARLLSTPGSVPPLPGPSSAADGMPLEPLWRPPLELLFIELHEERPIRHSVSDLGATVRMERFVPYFLERFKAKSDYPGKGGMYVLFPDHGAYDRYLASVVDKLKLDSDHILYMSKTRVGETTAQVQKLFFYPESGEGAGEKTSFASTDHALIVDDFTNSGSTLFGAVELVQKLVQGSSSLAVSIFVSHLVAAYDDKVVATLKEKLHALGPTCRFFTTNTIPFTSDMVKMDEQVEVIDISDFVADLVQSHVTA